RVYPQVIRVHPSASRCRALTPHTRRKPLLALPDLTLSLVPTTRRPVSQRRVEGQPPPPGLSLTPLDLALIPLSVSLCLVGRRCLQIHLLNLLGLTPSPAPA